MKFLVDECLSPHYVELLGNRGFPDAIHPLHVELLGVGDHLIWARALRDDRIIIPANRADFRKLLGREALHPGAIIIEALEKETAWRQILAALGCLEMQTRPADCMVNRLIEVSVRGGVVPIDWATP